MWQHNWMHTPWQCDTAGPHIVGAWCGVVPGRGWPWEWRSHICGWAGQQAKQAHPWQRSVVLGSCLGCAPGGEWCVTRSRWGQGCLWTCRSTQARFWGGRGTCYVSLHYWHPTAKWCTLILLFVINISYDRHTYYKLWRKVMHWSHVLWQNFFPWEGILQTHQSAEAKCTIKCHCTCRVCLPSNGNGHICRVKQFDNRWQQQVQVVIEVCAKQLQRSQ